MTLTTGSPELAPGYDPDRVREAIRDNLFLHFTQMQSHYSPEHRPLVLVKGEGSTVWDMDGNAYLDLLAGIYSVNAGYGRRRIVEAMLAQLETMPFVNPFGYASVPAAVLADRLSDLVPLGGDARAFFTSGGSEAVESALKLAKQYQTLKGFPHRWKTISRRVAYHGTTMGALSVNGLTYARSSFGPLVPGARHAPMSHRYRCPYCKDAPACSLMCYDEIERLVEFEGPEQVAAIITEPVQNAGGCIPPGSMDYFKKIRKLCDETGILMIMDEVICGFGRLGELFGSTYFGVEPDLITLAKGITSSYAPLGAVMVRKSVADHLRRRRPRLHPRPHVWRAPGLLRGRARKPGHLPRGGPCRSGESDRSVPALRVGIRLCHPPERRRYPGGRAVPRGRAGRRQSHQDQPGGPGTARLVDRSDEGARPDPAQRRPQRPDDSTLSTAGHHPGRG